jgi:hypothetical protein
VPESKADLKVGLYAIVASTDPRSWRPIAHANASGLAEVQLARPLAVVVGDPHPHEAGVEVARPPVVGDVVVDVIEAHSSTAVSAGVFCGVTP